MTDSRTTRKTGTKSRTAAKTSSADSDASRQTARRGGAGRKGVTAKNGSRNGAANGTSRRGALGGSFRKGAIRGKMPKARRRTNLFSRAKAWLRRLPSYTMWSLIALVTLILGYFCVRVVVDNAFMIQSRFGKIVYPSGDVRGIDISHYQEEIDWDRLRNADINGTPVRFIFIKATEGTDIIDENFNRNFHHARKNGILRGAYHFFSTQSNPVSQARHFCKIVQLEDDDLLPVLDVEQRGNLTPDQLRKRVMQWMDYVERHYGVTPILYTGSSFKTSYLNTPEFDRFPFWIAHYYVDHVSYKGQWHFWQHTDRGRIDGIKENVDINVFNGTYEQLLKLTVGGAKNSQDTSSDEEIPAPMTSLNNPPSLPTSAFKSTSHPLISQLPDNKKTTIQ